jgi:protein phosphatase
MAINQLMEENRRLTDPILMPQPKAYLDKIYNGVLGAYFMKQAINTVINVDLVYSLVQEVDKIISEEPTILRLRAPIKIFGDIHGQLADLNKLFETFGAPTDEQPYGDIESTDYLFLGDYVDRGNRSLEVVLLLFALKLKYPENIHLLRGAHEDPMINRYMGFGDECANKLGQNIDTPNSCFAAINKVFQKLPLAALI